MEKEFETWLRGVRGIRNPRTINQYQKSVKRLRKIIGDKKIENLDSEDYLDIRTELEERYATSTAKNTITWLRVYLKWKLWRGPHPEKVDDSHSREYPAELRFFRPSRGKSPDLDEKPVLTTDQIRMLVEAQRSDRNKALILLTYESGGRAREILNLELGDVRQKPDGRHYVHITEPNPSSKTMPREVPVEESVQLVEYWKASRPKAKKSDPMWLDYNGNPLNYQAYWRMFTRTVKRVREKHENFPKATIHTLRHSRATHLAQSGMNEAGLRKMFGWSSGSKMPSYYVERAALDLGDMLDRAKGKEVESRTRPHIYRASVCPECSHEFYGADFCPRCGVPISDRAKRNSGVDVEGMQERIENLENYVKALNRQLHA